MQVRKAVPTSVPTLPTASRDRSAKSIQELFATHFKVSIPDTFSEAQTKQALVLLDSIHPTGDHNLQKLRDSTERIPFSAPQDIIASVKDKLLVVSGAVKDSLMRSAKTWQEEPYRDLSKRPGFVKRTLDHTAIELTTETLEAKQGFDRVSDYTDICVVFDVSTRTYIPTQFTAVDHVDPWKKITQRVQTCLDFINTSPPEIKAKLTTQLISKHPRSFMIDNGYAIPTKYLAVCLYNDSSNLAIINGPENTSKNCKMFTEWIAEKPDLQSSLERAIGGKLTDTLYPSQNEIQRIKQKPPMR